MIIEIKKLIEIEAFLTPKAHLFFDLDNTLIESAQDIGTVQWENSLAEEFIKKGVSKEEAKSRANIIWRGVHLVCRVKFVEEETLDLIQKWHRLHPLGIATARSPELLSTTLRQFEQVGLSFLHQENAPLLHCGPYPKADVLLDHFKQISIEPERVILIDDVRDHLEYASEIFKKNQIPFLGLRYSYLDEKVKNYQPDSFAKTFNSLFIPN